jgi:hypothetical protein
VFGDQLQLLGHAFAGDSCRGQSCRLLTYWRVVGPAEDNLSLFLHATDDDGELIAQDDGVDAPSRFWQTGDVLVQLHTLTFGSTEPSALHLGVYDPLTGGRLLLPDGSDRFTFALP